MFHDDDEEFITEESGEVESRLDDLQNRMNSFQELETRTDDLEKRLDRLEHSVDIQIGLLDVAKAFIPTLDGDRLRRGGSGGTERHIPFPFTIRRMTLLIIALTGLCAFTKNAKEAGELSEFFTKWVVYFIACTFFPGFLAFLVAEGAKSGRAKHVGSFGAHSQYLSSCS